MAKRQRSAAEYFWIYRYYYRKNSQQQWQEYLASRTPSEYIADVAAYVADQRVAQYEQSQAASAFAVDEHECIAAPGICCPVCEPF